MCDQKCHSWDITEPIIWLWEDLPYPRPDLLCDCGKRELGIKRAKKYAVKGSLYGVKNAEHSMPADQKRTDPHP